MAKWGIYRCGKSQTDYPSDRGHTDSASAKVKRGGKHVQLKTKKEALDWIKENGKGEELFTRKVSKNFLIG